jgi:hypothetical protein
MQKVYHLGVATGLAICLSAPIASADVTIDRATKYQSIEGFGFFGVKFSQVMFCLVSRSLRPECGSGQRDCGDHAGGRVAPSGAAGGLLVSDRGWLGSGPRPTIGDLLWAIVLGLPGVLVLLDHGRLQAGLEHRVFRFAPRAVGSRRRPG